MLTFPLPTLADAPDASRPVLTAVQQSWGFTPNLIRLFANSPAALTGVWGLLSAFETATLSPAERQTVLLSTSVENDCHYCTAAHTVMGKGAGIPGDALEAIRQQQPVSDARLEALRRFTTAVVAQRGFVDDAEVAAFLAAGFSQEQVLEVVLGVAAKTLTNYVNHLTETPLDAAFKPHAYRQRLSQAA